MNRQLCFVLLLCGVWAIDTHTVFAQSVSIGPKFGLNMKDMQGKGATNYSVRPDFNAGFTWNYTGNETLNFGGEILYSRQGAHLRNTIKITSHTTLHYISAPFLFKYYFGSETRSTPFLFAGPQVSYLLGASNTLANDVSPQFKKLDISAVAGAGLRMQVAKIWWTVDVRIAPGINNISQSSPVVRNSVISANTSFEFGLRKKSRRGLH